MLQHVTFEIGSGDVEATVGMWALLGFERMEPPPLLRDRFVWVARGTSQIHLQPHEHPTVTDQGHAAVVVDDYEGTLAALRAAGFDPRPGLDAWDARVPPRPGRQPGRGHVRGAAAAVAGNVTGTPRPGCDGQRAGRSPTPCWFAGRPFVTCSGRLPSGSRSSSESLEDRSRASQKVPPER
jgi:hypothetical protein